MFKLEMPEPRKRCHRGDVAKAIMDRFFPDRDTRPPGLMTEIFKAIGEAETRGFGECLAIFEGRTSVVPGHPPGTDTERRPAPPADRYLTFR